MKPKQFPLPMAVKAIGWILLTYAAYGIWVLISPFIHHTPARNDSTFLMGATMLPVVSAVCGWSMLKGVNWGRILFFTICIPLYLGFLFLQGGRHAIFFVIPPVLIAPFLISRDANLFFIGRTTLSKPAPPVYHETEQQKKYREDQRRGRYDY